MENSKKNILSEFKGGLAMENVNIRIPTLINNLIDARSNETGESKVDILLRSIATEVLPKDLKTFIGNEIVNEIIKKIQLFYEQIYNNSEAVSFVAFVRERLLIDATTMTPEKRMKVAKHISSDIVYPDAGDTISRNVFIRILLQQHYLEQLMETSFELIRPLYNEAVNKIILSLGEYM